MRHQLHAEFPIIGETIPDINVHYRIFTLNSSRFLSQDMHRLIQPHMPQFFTDTIHRRNLLDASGRPRHQPLIDVSTPTRHDDPLSRTLGRFGLEIANVTISLNLRTNYYAIHLLLRRRRYE